MLTSTEETRAPLTRRGLTTGHFRRIVGVLLVAAAGGFFFATRVYVDFAAVRIRALRQPLPAVNGRVDLHVADDRFQALPVPAALIAHIRNDSPAPQEIALEVDGSPVCSSSIPANAARRVDCAIVRTWTAQNGHVVSVSGARVVWTVLSLEIASHHGHSTGILQGFVLPAESRHFRRPGGLAIASACIALVLLLLLEPRELPSPGWRRIRLVMLTTTVVAAALILVSPVLSPFLFVVSPLTFIVMVILATLSRTWPAISGCAPLTTAVSRSWTWCGAHQSWLVWAMSVAVTVAAGIHGARAVGGSDEYGYASQAELWLNGTLKIDQPFVTEAPWRGAEWSFAPLGYRPSPADPAVLVPSYAAGLPLLLALAKRIGGQEVMFWVVPLSAGLLVFGTYSIGRRLGAESAGLIAAMLVATSPVMLHMSTWLMTDVPVATVWAWAFYLVLGTTRRSAAGAGLLSALAVLIRPNLAPLAGVLVLRYVLAMRHREVRHRTLGQGIAFSAALLPGVVAVGAINTHLYGSPLSSGYGDLSNLFAWSRVTTNLQLYLQWFTQAHTPFALCGVVAILVPLRRLWPEVQDRSIFVVMALFVLGVWGIYCAWLVFDQWWFARFLLPSWPFIMLGIGSVAVAPYRRGPGPLRGLVAASVIGLAVFQLEFAIARGAFEAREERTRFVAAARLVRRLTDPNSVIASLDHSGSIRYYGGRMTMVYTAIPSESLDAAVEWMKAHGARTYLVVEEWELPEVRRRFAGSQCLRALDGPPVAVYEWSGRTRLFDLTDASLAARTTIVESARDTGPTATPVPPPRLEFTRSP
jgi:hypothetical protein